MPARLRVLAQLRQPSLPRRSTSLETLASRRACAVPSMSEVIVGEVGGRRRDSVFHGDVMNTTARLEQIARELDRRLVISAAAMSRLDGVEQYASEDLGDRVLRGRTSPVQIYAVLSSVSGR